MWRWGVVALRSVRAVRGVGQMGGLAWHAQPASFIGLLVLNVTQGLVPVATAWVTKLIFDLLAQALQGSTPGNLVASGRDVRRRRGPQGASAAPPSRQFAHFSG